MRILVIAEHDNTTLAEASLHAVNAAIELAKFDQETAIDLLVAGSECQKVAEQASTLEGLSQVVHVDACHYRDGLAENLAELVVDLVGTQGYKAVISASSALGKNVSPRIAALLDVTQISDVIQINGVGKYVRPIYAGNIMLTCDTQEPVQVLTIRQTAFDKAQYQGKAAIIRGEAAADLGLSSLLSRELNQSDRPVLSDAKIVVSGGRGLGNGENFKQLLEPLADSLSAALGASRAAVDAGFVSNDYQVGQTGKIVAPDLYIAVGISGAIQHIAGMSDAKVIVAINKDPDAPIFQIADYGLVSDLFTAVPELTESIAKA